MVDLRRAVAEAYQRIEDDPSWGQRHPRAALVRETLAIAASAPPGALFALAAQVVDDLDSTPWPTLPNDLAAHLRGLKRAVASAAQG